MAKKKHCRVATSSRHFAVETQTPPSKASIRSATSSKYFLHSPSSAIGSVSSVPSFLRTLIPSNVEDTAELDEISSCSCQRLAQAASAQFANCSIFQQRQSSTATTTISTREKEISCCDKETLELQSRVCHLCPHGCYLRAFAPLREWHYLRASVAELSEASPGMFVGRCTSERVIQS